MKICLAQTKAAAGDLAWNIENHKRFVDRAIAHKADMLVFPELSLTGYEPTLAQALAIDPNDAQLNIFQTMADAAAITLAVGTPTKNQPLPCISLLLFRPRQPRDQYAKQYLHPDEEPFFSPGERSSGLIGKQNQGALAICYEIAVPEHAANAASNGATTYIASVAKSVSGIQAAHDRLSEIARTYGMTVFLANCVGVADGVECGGQSAVWNARGSLVSQLDSQNEGILIYENVTGDLSAETL